MTLRLSLAKHPTLSDGCPTSVSVDGKARFVIGRDEHADWTLTDTSKAISAIHCEILFDGAGYTLQDLSTNGTYLNGATERLDGPHRLNDGDSIIVGLYLIHASLPTHVVGSSPRVEKLADDTGPQAASRSQGAPRGGDPAAMMTPEAGSWPIAEETKRPAEPHGGYSDMTMILPAPKRSAKGPMAEPPPAPSESKPPVSAPAPSWPAPAPSESKPPVSAPALSWPAPAPSESKPSVSAPAPSWSTPAPASPAPAPVLQKVQASPPALAEVPPPRSQPVKAYAETEDAWERPLSAPSPGGNPDLVLKRIADGLGVGVDALGDVPPDELAERLAVVTRRLVAGVKDLLDERTRAQRNLGSRNFAIPRGQARNPLKFSSAVEDALLLLLRPNGHGADAAITQSFAELKSHQQGLLAAAQTSARLLGEDLAPSAFAAPSHATTMEQKARLWDLYGALWQGLDADWAGGFVEAFKLHMASTYDSHEV